MMTAKEARETAEAIKFNNNFKKVEQLITNAANKGQTEAYIKNLNKDTIAQLRELGYKVTFKKAICYQDEDTYVIRW